MNAREDVQEWFKTQLKLHKVTEEQIFDYYDTNDLSIANLAGCIVSGFRYDDEAPNINDMAAESEMMEDYDTASYCDEVYNVVQGKYRSYCNK